MMWVIAWSLKIICCSLHVDIPALEVMNFVHVDISNYVVCSNVGICIIAVCVCVRNYWHILKYVSAKSRKEIEESQSEQCTCHAHRRPHWTGFYVLRWLIVMIWKPHDVVAVEPKLGTNGLTNVVLASAPSYWTAALCRIIMKQKWRAQNLDCYVAT